MLNDFGLLLLRMSFGLMMFFGHGMNKIQMVLNNEGSSFADPIGLGPEISLYLCAFAEGVCPLLLILGIFTRVPALVLSVNMIVATIVIFEGSTWFPEILYGQVEGFPVVFSSSREYPLMYAAVFLVLVFTGGGRFSLFSFTRHSEED